MEKPGVGSKVRTRANVPSCCLQLLIIYSVSVTVFACNTSITMDQGMGEDGRRRNDTGKISNNGFLVFSSHTI
jgi:hypothetical protein